MQPVQQTVVTVVKNYNRQAFLLCVSLGWMACSGENKVEDSGEIEVVPSHCNAGTYSVQLQVWSQSEQENVTEDPPLCEHIVDVDFLEGGGFQSENICEFERGGETRRITYRFSGQHQSDTEYGGEVIMIRGNGNEESSTFSGYCEQLDNTIDLRFDWYILLNTPNGQREHHGRLHYPIDEN